MWPKLFFFISNILPICSNLRSVWVFLSGLISVRTFSIKLTSSRPTLVVRLPHESLPKLPPKNM